MSLLEFLEFLEVVDEFGQRVNTRPRVIRPRVNNFQNFDDTDFFRRYRMSKSTVLSVLHQIDEQLQFDSDRNEGVTPIQQLLVALRFYATGTHLQAIGDAHGVSVSTVSRIIKSVTNAIVRLRPRYIKMPTSEAEIECNQRKFYNIANFPFVIGAIDCTHVKIQSPGGEDAELFRNRKGYFSVNVQTVCDADLKVRNVVARWPGCTHDSAIFLNSRICQDFEFGVYGNACLLGDSGYPLKRYLLTPYLNPMTDAQERYNYSRIRTRNTVERQYGVLKRRFPALAIGLRIHLQTAVNMIVACCILHNICIEACEEMPPDDLDTNLDEHITNGQIDHNNYIPNNRINEDRRTIVTRHFFSRE